MRDPGKAWYEYAQRPDAPDWARGDVYRLARTELARRVGLAYETPGDNAQMAWDALGFPKDPSYKEIDKILDQINLARNKMYQVERFDYSARSVEKEMSDLKRMVPLGTRLREHLYAREWQPTSFDAWFNAVQQWQLTLPRPKEESGKQGSEREKAGLAPEPVAPSESQEGSTLGADPWEQGDPWQQEMGGRLNDNRMAGGGRYQGARPKAGTGQGGKGGAQPGWHPVCARCKGRHPSGMKCPTVVAIEAGSDASKQQGVHCDFFLCRFENGVSWKGTSQVPPRPGSF